jgi:arylsulfatase
VRWNNWKFYYTMSRGGSEGWFMPPITYHWTAIQNVKRDPFEQAAAFGESKSVANLFGMPRATTTAFGYDFAILPLGQQLWEKELLSYQDFPPLQALRRTSSRGFWPRSSL